MSKHSNLIFLPTVSNGNIKSSYLFYMMITFRSTHSGLPQYQQLFSPSWKLFHNTVYSHQPNLRIPEYSNTRILVTQSHFRILKTRLHILFSLRLSPIYLSTFLTHQSYHPSLSVQRLQARAAHVPPQQVLDVLVGCVARNGQRFVVFLRQLAAAAHHQNLPHPAAHDVRDLQLLRLVSDTGTNLWVRVYDDSQEHILWQINTSVKSKYLHHIWISANSFCSSHIWSFNEETVYKLFWESVLGFHRCCCILFVHLKMLTSNDN